MKIIKNIFIVFKYIYVTSSAEIRTNAANVILRKTCLTCDVEKCRFLSTEKSFNLPYFQDISLKSG